MADSKFAGLTESTALISTDLFCLSLNGSAGSRKITTTNLFGTIPVALTMGTASANAGVFSMIQGAVASDPTFSITQATNDVTLAQTVGDLNLTGAVDLGLTATGGNILMTTTAAGNVDWTNGNVIYLGIGGDIEAAIAAATAGDTIVLASGTYTIDNDITVAKKVHIQGQGEGITTITCATDAVNLLKTTTEAGILISDLTLEMTGARTGVYASSCIKPEIGTDIRNVEFLDKTTGASGSNFTTAINIATASIVVNMWDCTFEATGAAQVHLFIRMGLDSTINAWRCSGTESGGLLASTGNIICFAQAGTANYYYCNFSSATNLAGGIIYNKTSGITNLYNCTLNGSGATAFDVQRDAGTLALYDTTLVNGTTSGTITYGGTVVTDNLYMDGTTQGLEYSVAKQHSEIGDLLDTLTSPVAIVGFTGTGADASTETGYENGAGRTWTYSGGATTDKIFQGQTYVYSFDGTDSYLSTPDTADMSFGDASNDSPMSIGGWIEIVNGGTQVILSKWDATTGSELREWRLFSDTNEKLFLVLYDESANVQTYRASDVALSVGWHYVTVTYDGTGGATALDGTNCVLYVDGVEVASTATNSGSYVAMEDTATLPLIGCSTGASARESFFTGDMGRLFVTAEELSAAQVYRLYESTRSYYNK